MLGIADTAENAFRQLLTRPLSNIYAGETRTPVQGAGASSTGASAVRSSPMTTVSCSA